MYKICKLTNSPDPDKASITIVDSDQEWEEAIKNWREGKNPTDDKGWRLGVIACTRLV